MASFEKLREVTSLPSVETEAQAVRGDDSHLAEDLEGPG